MIFLWKKNPPLNRLQSSSIVNKLIYFLSGSFELQMSQFTYYNVFLNQRKSQFIIFVVVSSYAV